MPGGIGGAASGARWYRARVSPAGAGDGRTGWLIADITRERAHQENIFQELQHAIDYLDHAPAGFFSLEPDGRIVYLNATLAEWLGIDLAEFEPGAALSATSSRGEGLSRPPAAEPEPGASRSRSTSISCATDGTRLPVRLLHRVPRRPTGAPGATRTLVLNCSPADDPEAGRIAEVRFTRFFNNTPIAIAAVDRQGRIGRTNARFVMLFGNRTAPAAAGRATSCRRPTAPRSNAAIDAAIAGHSEIPPIDAAIARRASGAPASTSTRSRKATTARTRPSSMRSRPPSSGRSSSSSRRARRWRRSASSPAASPTTSTTC